MFCISVPNVHKEGRRHKCRLTKFFSAVVVVCSARKRRNWLLVQSGRTSQEKTKVERATYSWLPSLSLPCHCPRDANQLFSHMAFAAAVFQFDTAEFLPLPPSITPRFSVVRTVDFDSEGRSIPYSNRTGQISRPTCFFGTWNR